MRRRAVVVLVGRFALVSDLVAYAGAALLVGAVTEWRNS